MTAFSEARSAKELSQSKVGSMRATNAQAKRLPRIDNVQAPLLRHACRVACGRLSAGFLPLQRSRLTFLCTKADGACISEKNNDVFARFFSPISMTLPAHTRGPRHSSCVDVELPSSPARFPALGNKRDADSGAHAFSAALSQPPLCSESAPHSRQETTLIRSCPKD